MAARQEPRERKSTEPRSSAPAVAPRIAAPSRNSETGGTTCRWRPWSTPKMCYQPPRHASLLTLASGGARRKAPELNGRGVSTKDVETRLQSSYRTKGQTTGSICVFVIFNSFVVILVVTFVVIISYLCPLIAHTSYNQIIS